jgi:co-chaperonin GroES (HSP10)
VVENSYRGNLIVSDLGQETNKTGMVLAVGPGHYSPNGVLIPTHLKVGDIVIVPTMGFTRFTYENEEYWVGKENEVLGRLKQEQESAPLFLDEDMVETLLEETKENMRVKSILKVKEVF